jgi:SAM-dependent methyltransferase
VTTTSEFSDVDASADPNALVESLDASAVGLAAMKNYIVAAARRALGAGALVLDVGCGAGHDLDRLAAAGLTPIGVDASEVMLRTARAKDVTGLARGDAGALPLRDGVVDGCRIERVLQHVIDPAQVVGEMARVLRHRGFFAVFEPDWTTLCVDSDESDAASVDACFGNVRHPAIGGQLVELAESHGFVVLDRVVEDSRSQHMSSFPVRLEPRLARAVREERVRPDVADRWLAEQRERDRVGAFRARWTKVLVVAERG